MAKTKLNEIDPETGEIRPPAHATPAEETAGQGVEAKVAAAEARAAREARAISDSPEDRQPPEDDEVAALRAKLAAMEAEREAKVAAAIKEKHAADELARMKAEDAERRAVAARAQKPAATPAAPAADNDEGPVDATSLPLSQRAAVSGPGRRSGGAVARPRSTAVAEASDLEALFAADAGRGLGNIGAEDLIIPRLYLLQSTSEQTKERMPRSIAGARPGMWYNTVTDEVYPAPVIIPVHYARRFVAWRARNKDGSGGGLVKPEVSREEYLSHEELGIGVRGYRAADDDGNSYTVEVVETPEWAALLVKDNGETMPCAVSFPKTKAKIAGKINSTVTMQVLKHADGSEYTPPAYANAFKLGSAWEGEGANAYLVPTAEYLGRLTDPVLFHRARKLSNQFEEGTVKVAEVGERDQE